MEPNPVEPGCLYLVATPIGNLEDITLRARRVLGEVTLIAAEDTRHTAGLLSSYSIRARLISYREQNHLGAAAEVLAELERGGSVALVTDAGTPALSDPGARLVEEVAERGFRVVPLPGPSAVCAALCASGLFRRRFLFLGFPPRAPGLLRRWAEELKGEPSTLVFFESPRRLGKTLETLAASWGERRALVAREMSKVHEQLARGRLGELASRFRSGVLGEITVVVEGAPEEREASLPAGAWNGLARALVHGERPPLARLAELVAAAGGFDRRAVYKWLLEGAGGGGRDQ